MHVEKGQQNEVKEISEVLLLLTLSHFLSIFPFSITWYQKTSCFLMFSRSIDKAGLK